MQRLNVKLHSMNECDLLLSQFVFDEYVPLDLCIVTLDDVTVLLRSPIQGVRDDVIFLYLTPVQYKDASREEVETALQAMMMEGCGLSLTRAAMLAAKLGDSKKQKKLLKSAEREMCPYAGMELGNYYDRRGKVGYAMEHYKLSADRGNVISQHKYALLCDSCRPRNLTGAVIYYTMAMKLGHPQSMSCLRGMVKEGAVSTQSLPIGWTITRMLHTASDLGCPHAKFCLLKDSDDVTVPANRQKILDECWEVRGLGSYVSTDTGWDLQSCMCMTYDAISTISMSFPLDSHWCSTQVFAECPTPNNAVFLARMYIPFRGLPASWGDPVKAIRLLRIAQDLGYQRGGTMLMKLCYKFGHLQEEEPTLEMLRRSGAYRVFARKKEMLRQALHVLHCTAGNV